MEILEGHNKFYVNDAQGNRSRRLFCSHRRTPQHYRTYRCRSQPERPGVGKQLVAKVVEKCAEQRKIIPLCPFAKHEFDNTREYDDIRA